MENFNVLFNVITMAAGFYCLITWFKLKKNNKLFENQLLIPKGAKPHECIDEESYIKFISLRLLLLGLTCALTSILCMLDVNYGIISNLFPQIENFNARLDVGCNTLCLIVLIWYMISWTKARKEYWI